MNHLDKRLLQLAANGENAVRRIADSKQPGLDRGLTRLLIHYMNVMDAEEKWITVNGTPVKLDENGNASTGPERLKKELNGEEKSKARENPPRDKKGKPFKHPRVMLPKAEYAKVMSEINTNYHDRYKGMRVCVHRTNPDDDSPEFDYLFENRGFDDYNIYRKEINDD